MAGRYIGILLPISKRIEISELWNKFGEGRWSPYVLRKFNKVRSTNLREPSGESASTLKIGRENVLNRQPRFTQFCSDFY